MHTKRRAIQEKLFSIQPIIHYDGAGTTDTEQELVTGAVSVLASDVEARYIEGDKVSLWDKRKCSLKFPNS
jgi:hypothetical protein